MAFSKIRLRVGLQQCGIHPTNIEAIGEVSVYGAVKQIKIHFAESLLNVTCGTR